MKKNVLLLITLLLTLVATGQPARLHLPTDKPIKAKDLARAWTNPEVFCLQLTFDQGDSNFRESDLDIMDSAYNIAFDRQSPRLYTMSIEAYGNAYNKELMYARVESVYRYFTMRGHEVVPVRYAYNPISCSCHGDTMELLRFEVPTDKQVYDCAELPESRKLLNKDIDLTGSILVTFRHNPEECLGGTSGCYLPRQDSTVQGTLTQLILPKGSIYSVHGTKDTCPAGVTISIEEHLDCKEIIDKFFLVPHRRQIILPVGYVVLHSSFNRKAGECSRELPDSIFIRFPVTEEQVEAKLRVFAKTYSDKGAEFKSLSTKKIKQGPFLMLQAALDPSQFDTIYLAKRIAPEEASTYLYSVDSPQEQSSVTINVGKKELYFKPFRIGRQGDYEYKKQFRAMLRIIEEEENLDEGVKTDTRNDGDEEID